MDAPTNPDNEPEPKYGFCHGCKAPLPENYFVTQAAIVVNGICEIFWVHVCKDCYGKREL